MRIPTSAKICLVAGLLACLGALCIMPSEGMDLLPSAILMFGGLFCFCSGLFLMNTPPLQDDNITRFAE